MGVLSAGVLSGGFCRNAPRSHFPVIYLQVGGPIEKMCFKIHLLVLNSRKFVKHAAC